MGVCGSGWVWGCSTAVAGRLLALGQVGFAFGDVFRCFLLFFSGAQSLSGRLHPGKTSELALHLTSVSNS